VISFAAEIQIEEVNVDCPFCDEAIDGPSQDGLHPKCHVRFGEEMAEAYPDEPLNLEPDDFHFEDCRKLASQLPPLV